MEKMVMMLYGSFASRSASLRSTVMLWAAEYNFPVGNIEYDLEIKEGNHTGGGEAGVEL